MTIQKILNEYEENLNEMFELFWGILGGFILVLLIVITLPLVIPMWIIRRMIRRLKHND